MENMDKGLTVPKWVLINWPNTKNAPKFNSSKVWDFNEKKLHWAFVVRDYNSYTILLSMYLHIIK